MIQTLKLYTQLLQKPQQAWLQLLTQKQQNQLSFTHVYWIMLLIMPFSILGKLIDIAQFNWSILLNDALLTFIALFSSLHITASLLKLYGEKAEHATLSYSEAMFYTAHASAAIYAAVWLVEITQMPILWGAALYTVKIVLESVQTGYLQIDEQRKYSVIWIISLLLIGTPYVVTTLLEMMIKME